MDAHESVMFPRPYGSPPTHPVARISLGDERPDDAMLASRDCSPQSGHDSSLQIAGVPKVAHSLAVGSGGGDMQRFVSRAVKVSHEAKNKTHCAGMPSLVEKPHAFPRNCMSADRCGVRAIKSPQCDQ